MINIADRRLDNLRELGHDWSIRNFLDTLSDDARRLPHLLDADHVSIVGVPGCAYRNIELKIGVRRVRLCLAKIPFDPRSAQRWSRHAQIDGFLPRNNANSTRAADPNTVLRQLRFVFIDVLREVLHERANLILEALINFVLRATDAEHMRRQPRSTT